ncbi:hypothetical protein TNCV_2516851 [Trichonephila clavipes]|nr:hypothetical protein TNCV_2516851 [Trichonephila clavipes]
MQQDWIHLYCGTLALKISFIGNKCLVIQGLKSISPLGIDSRDPAEQKRRVLSHQETFSLSNMSHLAFFAHANVFHHGGEPVPIEL